MASVEYNDVQGDRIELMEFVNNKKMLSFEVFTIYGEMLAL